jgi:endogenous inhibitor of DNA gyrase (YacG/DUF329 family)
MQMARYKDCRICGSTFRRNRKYSNAQWSAARYCSLQCLGQSKRPDPRTKACERCGTEFVRRPNLGERQWEHQRFCSNRCKYLVDLVPTPLLTHEVAWAAGLYEGEGTCGLFGRQRVTTNVQIQMTDLEPLERCRDALGFGYVDGPQRRRQGWKPIYVWRVGKAAEIVAFFDAVWPFLSERRKEQARPLIAHCKERISPYDQADV